MVKLLGTISRLSSKKVMVVGDFMVDTYTIGKVRRISPEAPVPVVKVLREEHLPGGAGNAILNLMSLGASVVAVGRVGVDPYGMKLIEALTKENVDTRGIFKQEGYPTPVKNRIIADNQQIVRVDFEENDPIPELLEQKVVESLDDLMRGVEVIAISDYAKGFLSRTLLSEIIEAGRRRGISVIVDPKGTDFSKYMGASIIKPNLGEAIAASGLSHETSLERIAGKLLEDTKVGGFFITRSEAGISLFLADGNRFDFPVRVREVKDVTGAGDTVLAMLTYAVANGLSLAEAAQLANIAAGIAIERIGCVRVSLSELSRRLLEEDSDNKVFDEEHLTALQEALKGRDFTLLGIDASEEFSSQSFKVIRSISESTKGEIVVYVKNPDQNEDLVSLLASLHDVNFIILKSYCPTSLCERIKPKNVYFLKNEALVSFDQETAMV